MILIAILGMSGLVTAAAVTLDIATSIYAEKRQVTKRIGTHRRI